MFNIDTDAIARALFKAAGVKPEQQKFEAVEEAIYNAKAVAQNPYNFDFYRIYYKLLEQIAEAQGEA